MSTGPLYTNPVYPESFPDPYVLKVRGEYWAYCTGTWSDGRRFGVLRSRDLVHWIPQAGALAPLPGDHPCYWAPEVVEHAGRFYLYYSVDGPVWRLLVGDEALMYWREGGEWSEQRLDLPLGFSPHLFHLLRLDVDGLRVSLSLDGVDLPWTGRLAMPASAVALVANGVGETFPSGVAFLPLSRRGEGGRWERGPGGRTPCAEAALSNPPPMKSPPTSPASPSQWAGKISSS